MRALREVCAHGIHQPDQVDGTVCRPAGGQPRLKHADRGNGDGTVDEGERIEIDTDPAYGDRLRVPGRGNDDVPDLEIQRYQAGLDAAEPRAGSERFLERTGLRCVAKPFKLEEIWDCVRDADLSGQRLGAPSPSVIPTS